MGKYIFYISSFQDEIHLCSYDSEKREMEYLKSIVQPKATFLMLSADEKRLYAGCEHFGGRGAIAIYDITDPLEPRLKSRLEEMGQGPAYMSLTEDEKYLLTCSYFSGDIKVCQLNEEGLLQNVCCHLYLDTFGTAFPKGSFGQAVPRAHCIRQLPGSDLVMVTDYSGDRLLCFRLKKNGRLEELACLHTNPGEAPRHIDFHPKYNNILYMNTEYSSGIYVVRVDLETGRLICLNRYGTVETENPMSSAVKISADGRYLYHARREHGNIAVFRVEDEGERLEFVNIIPDVGYVRDFIFSPDGEVLMSGNQEDNTVRMFQMNWENGMCAPLAGSIEAGTPACFAFCHVREG